MRSLLGKFDMTYLILIPGVFLTYFVPIRFRFGPIIIVPFLALWLVITLLKNQRCQQCLTRSFLGFFVPLLTFFLIHGYLFGYNEWDCVPISRHYRTYGIVLFYCYLLHYSLSRRKIKELIVLVPLILFSLAYGCFSYLSFEAGSARNQMKGAWGETFDQTYDRLERAFAGATNYGDTYGMVIINVCLLALLRFVPTKWKFVYCGLIVVYCVGVYRAAYTTATVLMLVGMALVMFYKISKMHLASIHKFMLLFSVFFVCSVAFPHMYSPFAGCVDWIGEKLPLGEYSLRLHSIAEAMRGYKDTYASQRGNLYWNSLDVFIHNPIFGFRFDQIWFGHNMKYMVRGHSFLFDSLACGGMFLGAFLVLGVVNFFKYLRCVYSYLGLSHELLSGWKIAIWVLAIIASINQLGTSFETMIVLVFVLPCLPLFNYEYLVMNNPRNLGWMCGGGYGR